MDSEEQLLSIRQAAPSDAFAIAAILMPVIRQGETYALDRAMTEADALAYWMGPDKTTFVATKGDTVVGTYYLRTNQAGGGCHVCNCGYMTAPAASGQGIAAHMCAHSLEVARGQGYRGMQFNFVVSTNTRAIQLWRRMGFEIVGTLPGAFAHPVDGYVDAYVMYRRL